MHPVVDAHCGGLFLQRDLRVEFPRDDEQRVRHGSQEPAEDLQAADAPFAGPLIAEHSDDHRGRREFEFPAATGGVHVDDFHAMRNASDGPFLVLSKHFGTGMGAMDDAAETVVEQAAYHAELVAARDAPDLIAAFQTVERLAKNLVDQLPLERLAAGRIAGEAGDEVIESRLMQDDDTGVFQREFVDGGVMRIVGNLVEKNVEAAGGEPRGRALEYGEFDAFGKRWDEGGGVVGGAGTRRGKGREKSDAEAPGLAGLLTNESKRLRAMEILIEPLYDFVIGVREKLALRHGMEIQAAADGETAVANMNSMTCGGMGRRWVGTSQKSRAPIRKFSGLGISMTSTPAGAKDTHGIGNEMKAGGHRPVFQDMKRRDDGGGVFGLAGQEFESVAGFGVESAFAAMGYGRGAAIDTQGAMPGGGGALQPFAAATADIEPVAGGIDVALAKDLQILVEIGFDVVFRSAKLFLKSGIERFRQGFVRGRRNGRGRGLPYGKRAHFAAEFRNFGRKIAGRGELGLRRGADVIQCAGHRLLVGRYLRRVPEQHPLNDPYKDGARPGARGMRRGRHGSDGGTLLMHQIVGGPERHQLFGPFRHLLADGIGASQPSFQTNAFVEMADHTLYIEGAISWHGMCSTIDRDVQCVSLGRRQFRRDKLRVLQYNQFLLIRRRRRSGLWSRPIES